MLTKKKTFILFSLLLMLLCTKRAYANGVPVMFAVTVFHIVMINTIVIVIETFLLKKLSRDLASVFLAYALTTSTFSLYFNHKWFGLENKGKIGRGIFLSGVTLFIFLTILIEWPFYHLAQKNNKSWILSLRYSAIINLATNIPIAVFYLVNDLYYEPDEY